MTPADMTSRNWLAFAAIILAGLLGAALVVEPTLQDNKLFTYITTATFTGAFLVVFGYYFGNSHKDNPPQ